MAGMRPIAVLAWWLATATALACTGGQGGDPGMAYDLGDGDGGDGDVGPGPNAPAPSSGPGPFGCAVDGWARPDAPRVSNVCTSNDLVDWECECGGTPEPGDRPKVDPGRAECRAALIAQCGVDPSDPPYCDDYAAGTCWHGVTEGTFVCRCRDSADVVDASAGDCLTALSATCAETCQGESGRCVADLSQGNDYRCECGGEAVEPGGFGAREHTGQSPPGVGGPAPSGPSSCQEVLSLRCGETCQTAAGSCRVEGADGYACACDAGNAEVIMSDAGRSSEGCQGALSDVCGQVIVPPVDYCHNAYNGVLGTCQAQPEIVPPMGMRNADNLYAFHCACDVRPEADVRARGCAQALLAHCPEALSDEDREPAAAGAPGALCERDDDCNTGTCFSPRVGGDALCSAHCADDGDCPTGTLCAFLDAASVSDPRGGYCFVTCNEWGTSGSTPCSLLNDAQDNPLLCADRLLLSRKELSPGVAAQVCVPRTVYYGQQ